MNAASVNDLRNLPSSKRIGSLHLLGYYSPNDGGGGLVWWDSGDRSTEVQEGLAIAPLNESGSNGAWMIEFGSIVNVAKFGIIDDGGASNQVSAFKRLGDWLRRNNGATVIFPSNAVIKTQHFDFINVEHVRFEGNGTHLKQEPITTSTIDLLRAYGPTIPFPTQTNFGKTSYAIETVAVNSTSITLSTSTDHTNFSVGNEIVIYGCPILYTGYPSANRYFEYNKIIAINATTGELTLENETRYNYYVDWDNQPAAVFNINTTQTTDKTQIYNPWFGTDEKDINWTFTWAKDRIFNNFIFDINRSTPDDATLRLEGGKQTYNGCKFIGKINITQSTDVFFNDCDFTFVPKLEIDKFVRYAKFYKCKISDITEASGAETVVVDDCDIVPRHSLLHSSSSFKNLDVSPRYLTIKNSRLYMTNLGIGGKWGSHTVSIINNTFIPDDTRRQVDKDAASRYGLMAESAIDTFYPYETIAITAIVSGEIVVGGLGASDANISELHRYAKEGTLFFSSKEDYSLMLNRIAINGSDQAILKGTLYGNGTPTIGDVLRYYKVNDLIQHGNKVQGEDSLLYFFHARGAQRTNESRFERLISKKDGYQDIQVEGHVRHISINIIHPTQSSDSGTSSEEFRFVLDDGDSESSIDFSGGTVAVNMSIVGLRRYYETVSTGLETGDTAMASGIGTILSAPYYCRTIRYWMQDEINSLASTAYDNPPLIKFIVEYDPI
ncbi:MAG: hypothetical protein AAF327_15860 [Cyanobacteria bacterium P01_A01_bin.37]